MMTLKSKVHCMHISPRDQTKVSELRVDFHMNAQIITPSPNYFNLLPSSRSICHLFLELAIPQT